MKTFSSVQELRGDVRALKRAGKTIAFVPTMGFLHEGHLSLVRIAKQKADIVIVSIFVNPTQFNDASDFEKYPIDIKKDSALLENEGAYGVFLPTVQDIYGPAYKYGAPDSENAKKGGFQSWISVDGLTADHEGACRPGHFRGVTTIVGILFNLVQPDFAVFGEKDFQQMRIIEQMVKDLKWDIEIVRGALIRENDGLALSSRNTRLDSSARQVALSLSQGLLEAQNAYKKGETNSSALCKLVENKLKTSPLVKIEYIKVVNEEDLLVVDKVENLPARIIIAAYVGQVRLIDNIALN